MDKSSHYDYQRILKLLSKLYEDEEIALHQTHTWNAMDGRQYEFEVLNFFKKSLGMDGYVTKASGDRGIDLVINGDMAIQCKHQQQNVSSSTMREFIGSCHHAGYKTMVFIAANGFTNEAKLAARMNNIALITTTDILNVINGYSLST